MPKERQTDTNRQITLLIPLLIPIDGGPPGKLTSLLHDQSHNQSDGTVGGTMLEVE